MDNLSEKAKSKNQQEFMSIVRKCQKTSKCENDGIKKLADEISKKDAKKYAETDTKKLPKDVDIPEGKRTFRDFLINDYNQKEGS